MSLDPLPSRLTTLAVTSSNRAGHGPDPGGCEHPGVACLDVLLTSPLLPETASMVALLHQACANTRVYGVDAGAFQVMPPPGITWISEGADPENATYPAALADAIDSTKPVVLLPWTDRDLYAVAKHVPTLRAQGTTVVCPPPHLVELACDPWQLLQRLHDESIPVPDTRLVHTGGQLMTAAASLGYPTLDLVLTPRGPIGRQQRWTIRPDAQPLSSGLSSSRRPQLSLPAMTALLDHLPPATLDNTDAETGGYLVQPELVGADITVDVLTDDGRVLAAVANTRDPNPGHHLTAGTVGPPGPRITDIITTVVGALGWSSLAHIRLVDTRSGPVITSVLPGPSRSIGVTGHTGLNLLTAAIRHARGEPLPPLDAPTSIHYQHHRIDQHWPDIPDVPDTPDATDAGGSGDGQERLPASAPS